MTQSTTSPQDGILGKPFEISVNNKPVQLDEPVVTGLQVKEAAIQQGVSIELDFQLAKVTDDGKQPLVGDSDKVDLREFKTFFATATDDNS
jgi:hypothetical protein